jgi:hypothetical protein
MPSKREMRKRIDEAVNMFAKLIEMPYETQREGLQIFKETGVLAGNRELIETMSKMMELPPADLTTAIRMLRGQLLTIKHDQFGDD